VTARSQRKRAEAGAGGGADLREEYVRRPPAYHWSKTTMITRLPLLLLFSVAACSVLVPDVIPEGRLVRIDLDVTMSPDSRTVTLRFVGGAVYSPTDPCSVKYAGWASPVDDMLEVAVVEVIGMRPPPGTACTLVGYDRIVEVRLHQPFLGTTAVDRFDGHTLEVVRPPG